MMKTWHEYLANRIEGKEAGVPYWVNDKVKVKDFCQEHQFPHPKTYALWAHPDKADFSNLPEKFVIKPNIMHSSLGVMVLSSEGPNQYFEAITRKSYSLKEIIAAQVDIYNSHPNKRDYYLIAEESLVPEDKSGIIPSDYKIFCFYDQPFVVYQIDRNADRKKFAWLDHNFDPFELEGKIYSNWWYGDKGVPLRPQAADEMLGIASRCSSFLKLPFISVDMFATARGPVIGELTPTPGPPFYGDWWNFTESMEQQMGGEWAKAIMRIKQSETA